jgi:hypothetical protein
MEWRRRVAPGPGLRDARHARSWSHQEADCGFHWGNRRRFLGTFRRSVPVGQQAELARAPDRIAARACLQLGEQAADVVAHPVRGQPELGRDDLVALPLETVQDLPLAPAQPQGGVGAGVGDRDRDREGIVDATVLRRAARQKRLRAGR